jgi:Fe-S cluster assembly protein SufD
MKRTLSIAPNERYQQLAARVADAPRPQPEWLVERRAYALALVEQRGFPTRHQEDWKYTDLSGLARHSYNLTPIPKREAQEPEMDLPVVSRTARLTFVDGHFSQPLSSLPDGSAIRISQISTHAGIDATLQKHLCRTNPDMQSSFTNLAEALWQDGFSVTIGASGKEPLPLHILNILTGRTPDALTSTRGAITIEPAAHGDILVETCAATSSPINNLALPLLDIHIEAQARLDLVMLQDLPEATTCISTTRIYQQRDSILNSLDLTTGMHTARHDLTVMLMDPGAQVTLNGIYLASGTRHVDNHTAIEHMKPNCTSRQLYKGVLSDKATAVFNGRVRVHPGAHGSDGAQTNRNLLLSPGAVVDTKPELEIDNDDVRCTHGATVGQLDPQELFYLHSRGIDPDAARIILSRAFVDEVLLRAPSNRWTEKLSAACASFFDGGQAS